MTFAKTFELRKNRRSIRFELPLWLEILKGLFRIDLRAAGAGSAPANTHVYLWNLRDFGRKKIKNFIIIKIIQVKIQVHVENKIYL